MLFQHLLALLWYQNLLPLTVLMITSVGEFFNWGIKVIFEEFPIFTYPKKEILHIFYRNGLKLIATAGFAKLQDIYHRTYLHTLFDCPRWGLNTAWAKYWLGYSPVKVEITTWYNTRVYCDEIKVAVSLRDRPKFFRYLGRVLGILNQ